ncbi:hypothetical protein [Psychrosphaera aestuarii]|uniref:hypothetical protein n=1 Tax=Psychrosphaera aestuarii TaxID=1266052 RepID=UPI001B344F95|nr:hypothetical protein [Psychrosphaera aestuarii]
MKTWPLITLLFLTGCVSAPKGETARLNSNLTFEETVTLINEYTQTCWTREASMSSDQIRTRQSASNGKVTFVIGRNNTDIPFMPFANIHVLNPENSQVLISIEEGKVTMTDPWEVDRKLSNWLKGNKTCI